MRFTDKVLPGAIDTPTLWNNPEVKSGAERLDAAEVGTAPLMYALRGVGNPVVACVLIMIALAIVSPYTSIGGPIKAEMFPMEVRALGVRLSYAVANAVFGGTAEYVALWFKSGGMEQDFYWYVTAMAALTFVVAWKMPDPQKAGLLK